MMLYYIILYGDIPHYTISRSLYGLSNIIKSLYYSPTSFIVITMD